MYYVSPAAGRMQVLAQHPLVVVDYAHTPDALEKALQALRPVAQARAGRLLVLFGCGGDRDPGKRPLMAQAAQRQADYVVVTADNPRTENLDTIMHHIREGLSEAVGPFDFVKDRAQAIENLLARSAVNDVVLLAGKGHETTQLVGDQVLPFSDAEHALQALAKVAS
ncbi:MAG: hypothetical protein HC848_08925 [Limnobacter sp.]|nr:hypothetical protein [Limnobacter sp.]